MHIIKKNNLLFFSIFLFFLIYFKFLFETFYFNALPKHDTLWSYLYFQYVYNYFELNQTFPAWIETNTGGYPAFGIVNFSSSAIAFPIIYISNFLGIGSYFAYLFLISIFTSIFLLGLFLFIKDNTKKYFLIFLIITISYLFSTDYFFISQSHWWYTLIPLQIFFLIRYFKEKNEKFIFYIINSQLIFSAIYWTYYNIFSIYLIGIIVFFFFLTLSGIYKKKIKLKFFFIKNISNILLFLFLISLNFIIFSYFTENYYINTPYRIESFSMSEYGFIGNIPLVNKLKKILFSEYTQSFYTISITNITLVFSIYILLNLKVFIKNYFLISLIFISIFVLVISCGDEFIITKQIIALLRIFPFMDIFKHYGYIIHFLIPLSLLITSISINYFLESKDKKIIFQSCLLAFLLKLICILIFFNFFNDYYDNIHKIKILSNLIISYLTISLGLYFVLFYKKFKSKYLILIILMIFSMLPTYIIAFEKYKNTNDFENVKTFYFQNNFSNQKKCIAFHDAIDNIPYFKNILSFAGNKYNIINFNLEKEICNPFAKITVDGSKKTFSKYLSSGQSIELRNTNIKNSLYLFDLFKNLKVNDDLSLDGIINNEDKYLMISEKKKISLWVVVFRIQFAHTYLNDGTKNNRLALSFHKNENNEWITKVSEEFKNKPLYKTVDNMKISNGFLKNTESRFIDQINKKNNLYNFKTINNEGEYNLKFSFNKNWKLKNVNKNKFKKISNKDGYISFNSDTKSDYILYYQNKIEFLIIFFQLILICYLILTGLLNLNRFYK
jgi:hypothetical protein